MTTKISKKPVWKKVGDRNEVLSAEGFWLSFNPDTSAGHAAFGEVIEAFTSQKMHMGSETALAIEDPKEGMLWLILMGDHRAEYEKAFPSLEACKKVYEKHKKNGLRSNWSTD